MTYSVVFGERAAALGLSYRELRELEEREPWVKHWSARFGHGAANLRAWLAAGRPRARRAELHLEFGVGDGLIATAARDVLDRLPESIAWFVERNVIVRCGRAAENPVPDAVGWVRDSFPDDERPIEVGLLVDSHKTAAHEFAHCHHRKPTRSVWFEGLDAAQRERLRVTLARHVVEHGEAKPAEAEQMQREVAADRLASLWLGVTVDTTSGMRGERRRRGMLRDLGIDGDQP